MSSIPSVINYLYYLKKSKKYTTVEFKVWGNCGQCKARIEKSLKIKGVQKANWNLDTKMLTAVFDPKVISLEQIHEKLASVGHDTEDLYTTKTKYQNLPDCCKYTREGK
jgi:copper chaperone CopZ